MGSRLALGTLLGISLVGAALRLRWLGRPLQFDEGFTYLQYAAVDSLWTAISRYDFPNNHLLHSCLAWLSVHALGSSPVTLRLPTWIAGVLLPPMVFLLARRVAGCSAALSAAALTAGCHKLIDYSVDARGYMLQCTLYVLGLWLIARQVERPALTRVAVAALALSAATFAVPTMAFGVGTAFVWGFWLAHQQPRNEHRRVVGGLLLTGVVATLITVLMYLPALLYVRRHGLIFVGADSYAGFAAYLMSLGKTLQTMLAPGLSWVVLAGLVAGVVQALSRREPPLLALWLAWPLLTLALHYNLSDKAPFTRNFLFLAPLMFVLAGQGLAVILDQLWPARSQWLTVGVALLLLGWSGEHGNRVVGKAAAIEFANPRVSYEQIQKHLKNGDHVAMHGRHSQLLRAYSRMDSQVRLRRRGARTWALEIMQRVESGDERPEPFQKRSRFFILDLGRGETNSALRWLSKSKLGRKYTFETEVVWESKPKGASRSVLLRVRRLRKR